MSQAPQTQANSSPAALLLATAGSFLVPVSLIALLITVAYSNVGKANRDQGSAAAITQRIMPVGTVEIKVAVANAAPRSGEEVYKAVCANCHGAGMMGAPKFGDAGAWGPRIGKGENVLLEHALKGFNAMPALGGVDLSDLEVHCGMVHLANGGGANFAEPAAPAADAASAP